MVALYVILGLFGVLLLLLLIAAARALLMPRQAPAAAPAADAARTAAYGEKLARLVRVETVSRRGEPQTEKYRAFHKVLAAEFPQVFAACEVHDVDGCLLIRRAGKRSDKPVLFLAHMDVVEANADSWTYPPFSGTVADGRVYGRGSGDTKCSLMAALQALEESIEAGYTPEQDVWVGSGCTEEIGGDGAKKMAAWLTEHGVRLALLCDEGGGVVEKPIAGIAGLYAMVGVYEKGYGDLRFTAHSAGGHSSTPPKGTPIPTLAKFVASVERRSPFKTKFTPEVEATFRALAPYCGFLYRMVLGNLWLFEPVLCLALSGTTAGAMLMTTCAFTMQSGSDGANVIPQQASVTANLRYASFQRQEESIAAISARAARYGVQTEVLNSRDPTEPVDLAGPGYALTQEAVAAVYPGVPAVPYVVTGGTDARDFEGVSDAVIRFSPVVYSGDSLARMHGIDEYLEAASLPPAVDYYAYLIRNCAKLEAN